VARAIDPYVDFILIGDSTAMVAYGLPNTLSISLETIAQHTGAVARSTQRACIVADLPFGSYQESLAQAFRSAGYLLSQGADAVKLEGGVIMAETIGLMPQYVNTMGGYLSQGKSPKDAARILADAQAVQQAGAFGVVLEGVQEALAAEITAQVSIPTIGIGASPACDGQILVTEDILGLSGERVPKFVKRYADLDTMMRKAVEQYAEDVRSGAFPEPQHCFGVKNT
jgi:3-methyl-2-oxobutanoate hydroxymethyltransferase